MAPDYTLSRSRIAFLALSAGLLLGWAILRFGLGLQGLDWMVAVAVALNTGDAIRTIVRERRRRSQSAA